MNDALQDKLYKFVEAHFDRLDRQGFIARACPHHGREYVLDGDEDGEFCAECSADGFSGELVNLGHDSEAIEIVDGLLALIDADGPADDRPGGEE